MILRDDIEVKQDGKTAKAYYKGKLVGDYVIGESSFKSMEKQDRNVPFHILTVIGNRFMRLKVERVDV